MKKFTFLFCFLTVLAVLSIPISASTYPREAVSPLSLAYSFNGETDTLFYLPDTTKFIDKYSIAEEIYSIHTRFSPKDGWRNYKVKEIQFLFSSMALGDTLKQLSFYKDTLTNLVYNQPVNVVFDSSLVYPNWCSIQVSNEFPVISGVVEIPLPMNSFSLCLLTNAASSGNTIGFYDKFQGWGVTGDLPIKLVIEKNDSTPPAKTIQVTFSVNMELERLTGWFNPLRDTVSVGGNFNSWGKNNMTVTHANPDIYSTTVSITATVQDTIRFSFCYSPDIWETVCVREYIITQIDYDNGSVVLDTIGFNSVSLADFPIELEFKCNMSVQMKEGKFVKGDKVFIRGDFNGWSGIDYELKDVDGDSIYSRVFPNFKRDQSIEFKFVHNQGGNDIWETIDNRALTVSVWGRNIYTAYWEDVSVYVPKKTIQVTFSVNMELERLVGWFNPQTDSVSVRGSFNGWGQTKMTPIPDSTDIYRVTTPVVATVDEKVSFKFFYSPNTWEYNNLTDETQKDRYFIVTQEVFDSGSMAYSAIAFNNGFSEPHAYITFTCNTNGRSIINTPPGTEFKTIHIACGNYPLQWPNDGWPDQDTTKVIQLFDDGTHNDKVAGDKIFTNEIRFPLFFSLNIVYKYSANWGLSINGGSNDNEAPIGGEKSIKLDMWVWKATVLDTFGIVHVTDLTNVEKLGNTSPTTFKLEQNYPNPFNPETVISYQLAENSKVNLKVYDVLGNEVATLVNEEQSAGTYEVEFRSKNTVISSGVFFYQLRAGNFVQTKKMILLR